LRGSPSPCAKAGAASGRDTGRGACLRTWHFEPAADGGADTLDALGHTPQAVIGDLDSITPALRARLGARVHPVPEQDSTDLDKCLRLIAAPMVLGLGFLGARLDHTVAALTSLVGHGRARVVLLGPEDLCFLAPPVLELALPPGARVSLYPMGPVTGRSDGLEWPIDGLTLTPAGRIGTSNRVRAAPLRLHADAPHLLVMLAAEHCDAVLDALAQTPDWPAAQGR